MKPQTLITCRATVAGIVAMLFTAPTAQAAVTISSAATQNMSCTSGVCSPTAANAVLNVGDLTTMLASGNVTVNTGTGSLAQQVEDIVVTAGFDWTSANALTLDAYRSVTVTAPVADNGSGAVSLVTNDGGSGGYLLFVSGGSLSFLGTANSLSINGAAYTLKKTLAGLASAIASNPAGDFAFASNYDAHGDGMYSQSPVSTIFTGSFNGLGNTISHISLKGGARSSLGGIFSEVDGGSVLNIDLANLAMEAGGADYEGGLVGHVASGTLVEDHVDGSVTGGAQAVGGLVGANEGTIEYSSATAKVDSRKWGAGGLVGENDGVIDQSFATGAVKSSETGTKLGGNAGGLVCLNAGGIGLGEITNSYATGSVKGWKDSEDGGLVGENAAAISSSYSTGKVSAPNKGFGSDVGGLIGLEYPAYSVVTSSYWDTTTSRTGKGVGQGNDSGVTGLTTQQFKASLPSGFDPTIWAESPKINKGFPYLIANPPAK